MAAPGGGGAAAPMSDVSASDNGLSTDDDMKQGNQPARFKHQLERHANLYDMCNPKDVPRAWLEFLHGKCFPYCDVMLEDSVVRTADGISWKEAPRIVQLTLEQVVEQHAYLYAQIPIADDKLDQSARDFLHGKRDGLIKFELYGLHTYGGYYGFFRPDAQEVFSLMLANIDQDLLLRCHRFYVTTDAHPSDKGSECYDSKLDRHKARTTVWLQLQEPKPKEAKCPFAVGDRVRYLDGKPDLQEAWTVIERLRRDNIRICRKHPTEGYMSEEVVHASRCVKV
jgi:hypothetical protein